MKKTISDSRYKNVYANFEVLLQSNAIDREPTIAVKVNPTNSRSYLLPMDIQAAHDLALTLFKGVLAARPELFNQLLAELLP